MSARVFDRVAFGAFAAFLAAGAVLWVDLAPVVVFTALSLLALAVIARPELGRDAINGLRGSRALSWLRRHPRALVALALAPVFLAAALLLADEVTRPQVSERENAALWGEANAALVRVAAADLRWLAATLDSRGARAADLSRGVEDFGAALSRLERVRPPESQVAAHASLVAIFADVREDLRAIAAAREAGDDIAAGQLWRAVALRLDEAAALTKLVGLGQP